MKQVYAVGTREQARATIKASSAGTAAEVLNNVLPLASYPMAGTDARPAKLSLLRDSSFGRVLTHVAPAEDRYFSHVVLDVPATADAQTAIQTWGSPQWQRSEDAKTVLPDLPFLPVSDRLDEQSLRTWLADTTHREMLEFTIAALVISEPAQRITLNATSDDVAMIVYAVTRALPANLTDDLTFSTFEIDPVNCSAKIVGCDRAELPDGSYANGHLAFDPRSGRKSPFTREIGFAKFATDALASTDLAALDEFRVNWQRLGLSDTQQFDLFDRLSRGTGPLDRNEMTTALQSPSLAVWVSAKPDTINQLTEWALDDATFATGPFARVVQAMRPKADTVAALTEAVKQAGFAAVKSGDVNRAGNAFDVILPMVAPAKANAVWDEVKQLNPGELSWETRWKLLPRLVRQTPNTASTVAAWLDVPTDQLDSLLKLDLPQTHLLHAVRADRPAEDLPAVAAALVNHPTLSLHALQAKDDADEFRAVALFESFLTTQPQKSWFDDVLSKHGDYAPALLNRFFESHLEKGPADAERLVRSHGPTLLSLFKNQPGLQTLTGRFLAKPPADLFAQPAMIDYLTAVKSSADTELQTRIDAVLAVSDSIHSPTFDAERLQSVAQAFAVVPSPLPENGKTDVFRGLAQELAKHGDSAKFQTDFETVCFTLGDTLAKGPSDLYQDLLRELRGRDSFKTNLNAVSSSLALALGAGETKKMEGLEAEAYALASDASKLGGWKFLEQLDRRTQDWPREAKAKWGFLKEAVRPPATRIGRDIFCFLFGVALTALGMGLWWLLKDAGVK